MHWWVHDLYTQGRYTELIAQIFWVILSITLHELGHGWAALRQGDRTPIELGHMNMNPMTHMGPQSLLLFLLCGFAWGAMPVQPHRFRSGRLGRIFVAGAGPLVNIILAVLCVVLLTVWLKVGTAGAPLYRNLAMFLFCGAYLNVFLAIFNMLPVPPLDGSRILEGLSRRAGRLFAHPNAPIIGLGIFILIFFATPIGDVFWLIAGIAAVIPVDLAGTLLGNPPLFDVIAP